MHRFGAARGDERELGDRAMPGGWDGDASTRGQGARDERQVRCPRIEKLQRLLDVGALHDAPLVGPGETARCKCFQGRASVGRAARIRDGDAPRRIAEGRLQ